MRQLPSVNKNISKKINFKNKDIGPGQRMGVLRFTATHTMNSINSNGAAVGPINPHNRSKLSEAEINSTDLETEHTKKLGLITFYPGGRNIRD